MVIPFCYRNTAGRLVGYDVSFMYKLARDMNVRLEYVPTTHPTMIPLLASGATDIAANSIYVTRERMRQASISKPYLQTSLAILARSSIVYKMLNRRAIEKQTGLKIVCMKSRALMPMARAMFPGKKSYR